MISIYQRKIKMKLRKLIVVTFALLSSFGVSADVMRGVKEITILVEGLDSDASSCNISTDMIDASVRLPLSNSRIKIVRKEEYPDAYLYAYVMTIDSGAMCRMYVELAYYKFINVEKKYGQFWRKNVLLSNNKATAGKVVADDLEAFTKQFISAWLKANPN